MQQTRFIFQIQGANTQIITFSQKRKKSIKKEKKEEKRKTGLRFQREDMVECVCLTDAHIRTYIHFGQSLFFIPC